MRLIETSLDQFTLCGWSKLLQSLLHKETICAVGMYPESITLVFKNNPAVVSSIPVFVNDDPLVILNEIGTPKSGTQPTCNHIYDLFQIASLLTLSASTK